MDGEEHDKMPKQNPRDLANAKEWLEEMGFVIDEDEQPQTQSDPTKRKPAA